MSTVLLATDTPRAPFKVRTIEALTSALTAERAAQAAFVAEFDATAVELGGHGGPDRIVGREIAGASGARARQVIEEIDAALARIADGSFGVCERCSVPIADERLEAIPYARFCVRCAG